MPSNLQAHLLGLAFVVLGLAVARPAAAAEELVLFDFGKGFNLAAQSYHGAQVSVVPRGDGAVLRLATGHAENWPGISLNAPGGHWDLGQYEWVSASVKNVGTSAARVGFRMDSPKAADKDRYIEVNRALQPGDSAVLKLMLNTGGVRFSTPVKFVGMRGVPGPTQTVDPTNLIRAFIYTDHPDSDKVLEIESVRAGGAVRMIDQASFFPFIDEFGQYARADWPGKTHAEADLKAAAQAEAADLKAHPGPDGWDSWGGWTAGPKLDATGFFRTQKVDGKWWLVDPDGRLFWSHGIDCVRADGATPITDRLNYFADLPAEGSPLARFYGRAGRTAMGYSAEATHSTFDFASANLFRKYGDDYATTFAALAHQRIRSWGMNTIGNWSDGAICLEHKTPYVDWVSHRGRAIEGSEGYWGKFPDPFDPAFRSSLAGNMARKAGKSAGDPWCIGFFSDNELTWGDDTSLALAALRSPADQPAKLAFVADLKAKYTTIEALNAAWGMTHASWDALLQDRTAPDAAKAGADLRAFYSRLAETYFRVCKEEVKRVAPNNLYLGCRFAGGWDNEAAVRAAAKYCDVVSMNLYQYTLAGFKPKGDPDVPVMIGEFHFGALDRGMLHPGLGPTGSQQDRAADYAAYVRSALANPLIVGTHWFQYVNEPTTGRGLDGENYQIGFLDVCDTPYPETIAASRQVGYGLYEFRTKSK